jgi:hypothetical protein
MLKQRRFKKNYFDTFFSYHENQDVGGWTMLKWILREVGCDGVDLIDMAHDRDQWRALVNTIVYLRVP